MEGENQVVVAPGTDPGRPVGGNIGRIDRAKWKLEREAPRERLSPGRVVTGRTIVRLHQVLTPCDQRGRRGDVDRGDVRIAVIEAPGRKGGSADDENRHEGADNR